MNKKIVISAFLVLLAGIACAVWWRHAAQPPMTACTMEAKLCPDGSYVGRSGPDCAFAACPEPANASWVSRTDPASGVMFRYPERLATEYISVVDWPPAAAVTGGPFTCTEAGAEIAQAGITERRAVNGRIYCVTRESEGAAGSIYTNYAYASEKGGKVLVFTFSLRATQCANYDDPQKSACEAERASFSMDAIADGMAQSAVLP